MVILQTQNGPQIKMGLKEKYIRSYIQLSFDKNKITSINRSSNKEKSNKLLIHMLTMWP